MRSFHVLLRSLIGRLPTYLPEKTQTRRAGMSTERRRVRDTSKAKPKVLIETITAEQSQLHTENMFEQYERIDNMFERMANYQMRLWR